MRQIAKALYLKGNNRTTKALLVASYSVFLVCAIHTICILFTLLCMPIFEMGTENISIASAQRVADGLPPVTRPDEIPNTINSFAPFAWILIAPILRLLNGEQVMAIATTGRLLVLVFVILSIACMQTIGKRHFPEYRQLNLGYAIYFSLLFVAFPGSIFVFRPDMVATFFELLSFSFVLRHLSADSGTVGFGVALTRTSPFRSRSRLGWAAVSASTAVAAKQNAIGVAFGTLLFLLSKARFRSLLLYLAVFLLGIALWYGCFYLYLGEALKETVLGSTASELIVSNIESAIDFTRKLIRELGFGYLIFYILGMHGLLLMWGHQRDICKLTFSCLTSSFVLATIGQLKTGAWYNYHYTFFFLLSLPASLSISFLIQETARSNKLAISLLVAASLSALLYLGHTLTLPFALVRSSSIDYGGAARLLKKDFPSGLVYANNSEANYLHNRALFTPWSEGTLGYSPGLSAAKERLRKNLSTQTIVAAVVAGDDCQNWQPNGMFKENIDHIRKLHAKLNRICIFEKR